MEPRAKSAPSLWLCLWLVLASTPGDAARILAIFPTPSVSHQMPLQAIMKALVARGHHVTVIGTDPLKQPMENYTDIDLSFSYKTFRAAAKFAEFAEIKGVEQMFFFTDIMEKVMIEQLESPQIQDFLRYNASQGYDMVFLEWLMYPAYFGLVHAVGSPPLVGAVSIGGMSWQLEAVGNPNNPAYNPELMSPFSDHMTFWERLHNTYDYLRLVYHFHNRILPKQEEVLRKHFGSAPPSVFETQYNASLMLLSNHWTTEYPRALVPNLIQLTGLHVRDPAPALPPDLREWLDGATHGVVYFSLGSNVQSRDLPERVRTALVRAMGRLQQRVLWKWEDALLPGRPDNVRVERWLPQQAVLAHPNVRLFVTQGGLQSFQEAAYHGVPLLGVPFIGDQPFNVAKMASAGIGERLLLKDLTEESFLAAVRRLLGDPAVRGRMKRFSAVYREHKARSLDDAMWWVEYVLRHEGAPHLRSGALRLRWYQLLLLDVLAFALACAAAAGLLLYLTSRLAAHLFLRAIAFMPPVARRKKLQ